MLAAKQDRRGLFIWADTFAVAISIAPYIPAKSIGKRHVTVALVLSTAVTGRKRLALGRVLMISISQLAKREKAFCVVIALIGEGNFCLCR